MKTRNIFLYCELCKLDFTVVVEVGQFIEMNKNCYVRLKKELQGIEDLFIKEISCPECGLCVSLASKSNSVTYNGICYL